MLIYMTDRFYNPKDEGRIPYNHPGINYDWETSTNRRRMTILVTGGAGFIGSAFVRLSLGQDPDPSASSISISSPTPATWRIWRPSRTIRATASSMAISATRRWWTPFWPKRSRTPSCISPPNRTWTAVFLAPEPGVRNQPARHFTMLEAARRHHIAALRASLHRRGLRQPGAAARSHEEFPLNPSSPYSASKAGADLLARSYFLTYKLPVLITRASNNYGPYHFPEKLIPLMISNALEDRPLPSMATGCRCATGSTWTITAAASARFWRTAATARSTTSAATARCRISKWCGASCGPPGKPESLIEYVTDRPGHDRRYALSSEKLMRETGWAPQVAFDDGLARTVDWYRRTRIGWRACAAASISATMRAITKSRDDCAW
jgi:dTDP-glucose 4,6-dehydratase